LKEPTGVRAAPTMTTSVMEISSLMLQALFIPYRSPLFGQQDKNAAPQHF
jgi:hypothetical protein